MHRDLVERRQWVSEADYNEGLALAQLGIYLGYVHYGVLGATLAGLAFVLPSFLMVLLLGWAYVSLGGIPWMQAVFYGVGAAVISIIAMSAQKLTVRTLKRDYLLWAIYLVALIATVAAESENVLLFLGTGVLAWLVKSPPRPRTVVPAFFLDGAGNWAVGLRQGLTGTCCCSWRCSSGRPGHLSSAAASPSCRSCTQAASTR